ncbi:MAG TPA: hypothetical protein VK083_13895 [Nocardia sp.]|uniref:hypothetical protein n=1 Tax=Nocardia sp. TaxID=1821 RepID=UPI002B4B7961|nr:hypothetical protein [Nocardia sp.]HLS77872.1 hypothetical protein [Nocardia sp.]
MRGRQPTTGGSAAPPDQLASVFARLDEDPITPELRESPVPSPDWLPGPALPWVLRERRVVPEPVAAGLVLLEKSQRRSTARRYVG